MCHQTVGLIQGAIEAAGLCAISMTVRPEITHGVRVACAAHLRSPTGSIFGEPHKPGQQDAILGAALRAAAVMSRPGIVALPFRWRRMGDM